jgi:hypothetical protein
MNSTTTLAKREYSFPKHRVRGRWLTALSRSLAHSARAPTADLPNTAALLGGVVAQEVIKMITKQYVPIEGYCTIDLVETWTGMLNA